MPIFDKIPYSLRSQGDKFGKDVQKRSEASSDVVDFEAER
jgi:hypothetical protein